MSRSLVCLLFGFAVCGAAAEPPAGILDRDEVVRAASTVTREAYPNADDVLVDDVVRIEYQADGTSVTRDDEYVKVLTEKGKRARRTLSFGYMLPYDTVEIPLLEILRPDGTIVPVDVAAESRTMVDPSQMGANIYNPDRKILTVNLPGLEIGDLSHVVSVRRTVKPRVPDTWSDYSVLEYTSPLKRIVYEVFGPSDRPLRALALRDEVPGTVSAETVETEHGPVYRWEVRDVPRMYPEPNMPPLHTVVQRLLVSTIPDWETISRWYWNLCLPHLEAVTPDMQAKVAELTADAEGDREKIERLFQFVSQQIRYMGITTETEAPGYEPHDVRITFENRYGVCRDKAALLVSLLREAGLEAYPVLIDFGPLKDEDVPQPFFNHAVAAVSDGGAYLLMDPTDENTTELLPAYLCRKSYLVAHPDGESLRVSPIDPATNNLLRIETAGAIDGRGRLRAESELRFEGINDNSYRGYFSRIKPVERKRFFEGRLKGSLPGATLTDLEMLPADMQDTSEPLTIRLRYEVPDYLVEQDGYAMFPPSWLGFGFGYVNFVLGRTGLEERRYPLSTEIACGVTEAFAFDLEEPLDAVVERPPGSAVDTNRVVFRQSFDVQTNRIAGASRFLLHTVEFSPAQYRVLKQQLKDIEYNRRQRPIFRTTDAESADHDVRVLHEETSFELADAHTWTARTWVRKKILTYAGKKKSAELSFPHNPVWKEVRLERASVTNPDSTTRGVSEEEINLMDAGWVGAAPRYPPERVLVVSLPGVEIGSVIEYEVTVRSRNVPFFSLMKSFGSFEPVERSVLRIAAPEGLPLAIRDETGGTVSFREWATGGRRCYEWAVERPEPVVREGGLPPWWSFNPTVFVSGGDWRSYAARVERVLEGAAARRKAARRTAREVIAGVRGRRERARAIRDYTARFVRGAGPGFTGLPLAHITPADAVLASGYGNGADRAVALFALLAEAGLRPAFVLASSWGPRLPSLAEPLQACPQRGLFDQVLVRVELDGDTVYLNDTDQYARLGATGHDGRPALDADGVPFVIHAVEGMEDRSESHVALRLDPAGDAVITVTRRHYGNGYAVFHRRFAEMPPEERRRQYRERIAGISQAAEPESDWKTDYEAYPGIEQFCVRVPRYAVRSGEHLYFSLPSDGLAGTVAVGADTRENPLYRGGPVRFESVFEVDLPEDVRQIHLLPPDVTWQAPGGLGSLQCRTEVLPDTARPERLRVSRELRLEPGVVPADNYGSLLSVYRTVHHRRNNTVLIRVAETGAAAEDETLDPAEENADARAAAP